MGLNYKGFFKAWEIAIVKNLINEFQNKCELLEQEGFDDLLQECLTHWFFVRDDYDSSRKTPEKTFMSRVIRNKLSNIIRKIFRAKRKTLSQSISFEELLGDYAGAHPLIESITENNDHSGYDIVLQTHLKIDIPKVLQKLTSNQKTLCHLLGNEGLNMTEASEQLKISRSTLYDEIKRIREVFKEEGFEDYLR